MELPGMCPCPPSQTLAGCVLHTLTLPNPPTLSIQVNVRPVTALLDSGNTVTLAHPNSLGQTLKPTGTLLVTCVHEDVREVLVAKVHLTTTTREWSLLVRLIPELPVPLLLG